MSTYVLVVDDNPSDLTMASFLVEKEGAVALKAVNGFDALEKLDEEEIKLFLVDLQMPQMSGLELIKRIRRTEKYKDTPILVVSGRTEVSDVQVAIKAGATDYIVKPIDSLIFEEKFNRLVGTADKWVEYDMDQDSPHVLGFQKVFFNIVSLGEVGMTIATKHKVETSQTIDLGAVFLEEIGVASIQAVVNQVDSAGGVYRVKLSYAGLTEADRKKIRVYCADMWRDSKKQVNENSKMKD